MQKEISGEEFIKELVRNSRVENCIVRDVAILKAGQVFTTHITISNCCFRKGLQILQSEFQGNLTIANCVFEGSHSDLKNDNCLKGDFKGEIHLINLHVKNGFKFSDCIAKLVKVQNGAFESRFHFEKVKIDDCTIGPNTEMLFLSFGSGEIEHFGIQCKVVQNVIFGGLRLRYCVLSYGKYENVSFQIGCKLEMFIAQGHEDKKVPPFQLNKIRFLQGVHSDSNINIGNVKLREVECRNLISKCNIKLYNIVFEENSNALFLQSDLSNIEFNSVDFRNAKLSMENSYVSETKFSNIKWPNRLYSVDEMDSKFSPIKSSPSDLASMQETYRQLKFANQKQGNRITSLAFYRKEMEIYWMIVLRQKKKSIVSRLEDLLIIGLNKFASNFGQNLLKPIAWLLVFHLVLFLILILNWNMGITISWANGNWKDTWYAIGVYFHTLNPAHRLLDASGNEVYSVTNFLMRISSAFFIYHIITASRKYISN